MAIGPQTPRIEWSIQASFSGTNSLIESSPVLDRFGRVFTNDNGIVAVDSYSRSVLWSTTEVIDASQGTALANGRVVWGDAAPFSRLRCHDAETGEEIWSFQGENNFTAAPVIDEGGVVYARSHTSGTIVDAILHARRLSDGSEVWTQPLTDPSNDSPSLLDDVLVTSAGLPGQSDLGAFNPADGSTLWTFDTSRELMGITVVAGDRVYFASTDRHLYAVNRETGEEIWRFWCEQSNRGSVAISPDGETIYTATTGNVGILFAVSRQGEEIWRLVLPGLVPHAPVVGGDGTVYLVSTHFGQVWEGRVHAVRQDGTLLWERLMPDAAWSSPMLAPDGTLYVICRDNILYAFKDPNEVAVLSNFQLAAGTIVSGDATKLNAADDDYLVIRSRFGFTSLEPNIVEFTVSATPENQDPRFINIELEGKLDHPSGTTRIWQRNWNTNQFDQIVTYGLGQKEFRGWSYQHDAATYAHPVSERIDVNVRQSVIVVFSVAGFKSSLDYLEVEVM